MENTPDRYIERLLEISNKKYKLLQEMRALTREQAQNLNEDGVETLQRCVDEKQKRIDAINKGDEEFDVYYQRFKQKLNIKELGELKKSGAAGSLDTKSLKDLQELIQSITEIVKEIFDIEKRNNEKANELLGVFANEVKKISQSKKIDSAYRFGSYKSPSYYIDKKK